MNERITSADNRRIKAAARLRTHRGRVTQGRILIDGLREIERGIEAGLSIQEVFVSVDAPQTDALKQLIAELETRAPILLTSERAFSKIAFGDRRDGMVVVAEPPDIGFADLRLSKDAVVAVMERVEKPGNVGAVLRTADATGVEAVILVDSGTDLFSPNLIRASLGAAFMVPLVAASTSETLEWLRRESFQMVACRVDEPRHYTEPSYLGRTAIILGSETAGLSEQWDAHDVQGISLPMRGAVDSLNVSVTGAVLFYEALRQRTSSLGGDRRITGQ